MGQHAFSLSVLHCILFKMPMDMVNKYIKNNVIIVVPLEKLIVSIIITFAWPEAGFVIMRSKRFFTMMFHTGFINNTSAKIYGLIWFGY